MHSRTNDARIQQDVLRELHWDTRVEETEVGVAVDRGVVALTGTVGSWACRLAAQEAAHRVANVLDVANDIKVRRPHAPSRTDADIAHAVRHALEWDVLVPDEHIQSTVSDGEVTLSGSVLLATQREDAATAVKNLQGVRSVLNLIEVLPAEIDLSRIRRCVEEALERRAERSAHRIEMTVHDGTVVLSGRVRSWPDKRAALGAATGTLGVRRVEDHLTIDPEA